MEERPVYKSLASGLCKALLLGTGIYIGVKNYDIITAGVSYLKNSYFEQQKNNSKIIYLEKLVELKK